MVVIARFGVGFVQAYPHATTARGAAEILYGYASHEEGVVKVGKARREGDRWVTIVRLETHDGRRCPFYARLLTEGRPA